jgi:hypothetical protein
MNRRANPSSTSTLRAAAAASILAGALLAASPVAADDFQQLRRSPTVRAPHDSPGGRLYHSPGAGDVVPIPEQPIGPPCPRPPQHESPYGMAPRPADGLAIRPGGGRQPALPFRSVLASAWLYGWMLD